jgi:hypothetical protein
VRQSSLYLDPETGKGREIDIIASDPDVNGVASIYLVAECKSSQRPWVLLASEDTLSGYNRLFAFGVTTTEVRSSFAPRITDLLDTLPWLRKDGRTGYSLRQAFAAESDPAFSAAMSLAKACAYLILQPDREYRVPFVLAFPVIVVDTPLLECWLAPDRQLRLEEVTQGEFLFIARLPQHFGSCIRVVTAPHLEAFAQEAKDAAGRFRAALPGAQTKSGE